MGLYLKLKAVNVGLATTAYTEGVEKHIHVEKCIGRHTTNQWYTVRTGHAAHALSNKHNFISRINLTPI